MNQTKKKNPLKRLLSMRGMGQVVTVTIGLIVLLVAFALINPNFWSPTNRTNLLRQIAPILIIGIAQSYVLITGNIDLSIGSVVGMSTMVAATLMSKGIMSPIPALLVTLLCCLLIGVLNGLLVAKFKLPPFIATLGTMTVARGIAQLVNGNYNTDSIMKFYPEAAQTFKNVFYYGKTLGLYNGIWIAIILWITQKLHGVDAGFVAIAADVAFFAAGLLTAPEANAKGQWTLVVFIGGILSIAKFMNTTGVSAWLASLLGPIFAPIMSSPYIFVPCLCIITFALRYVIVSQTCMLTMMIAIFGPLMEAHGMSMFILVFVEWLCGTYWNTAYGNPSVVGFIKMTGDKCVDYPCAQKASYAYMVMTIIAMVASVPLWQAIGLC